VGLRQELDAVGMRPRHVGRHKRAADQDRLDEIPKAVLKIGGPQANPLGPEALVNPDVPALAVFWLQIGVAEAGEEEVVDRRGAEALAPRAAELAVRLGDQEHAAGPVGRRRTKRAIVIIAATAGQDEAIEEP